MRLRITLTASISLADHLQRSQHIFRSATKSTQAARHTSDMNLLRRNHSRHLFAITAGRRILHQPVDVLL